jgi:hypothetical protein
VPADDIKWFKFRRSTPDGVVTRETVDAALGIEVREVVDHALAHYRAEVDRRLRLIDQNSAPKGATAVAQPVNTVVTFPRAASVSTSATPWSGGRRH